MFNLSLIPYWPWILGACAVAGLLLTLVVRIISKASAGAVVGGTIEGLLCTTLGAAGGLVAGLFFSWLLASEAIAFVSFVLALVCVTGIVLGLIHGTGGFGRKFSGVILYLVFAAAFVVAGILIWGAERNATYVGSLSLGLAIIGASMGALFAIYRSAHWSFSWLLALLNGSWGILGSIMGLLVHLGTWTFFKRSGAPAGPGDAKILPGSERRFFHCWQNGMRIMDGYFFSQGPVMTAWTTHGMWHEAVHIVQHYIFGPIMLVSYLAWAALFGLIGGIVGLFTGNGVAHGAFAWAYLNNPYEVWEYNSSWGTSSATPRKVTRALVKPGKTGTDMVFPNPLAWTLTVIWIALWSGAFALLVVIAA